MGFQADCSRCYARFEYRNKVYCDYCNTYFRLQKEKKELEVKLNQEAQNKEILNQKLTEKDSIIESMKKRIEQLEITKEQSKSTYSEVIESNEIDNRSDSNYSLVEEQLSQ